MQVNPTYENLLDEIFLELKKKTDKEANIGFYLFIFGVACAYYYVKKFVFKS